MLLFNKENIFLCFITINFFLFAAESDGSLNEKEKNLLQNAGAETIISAADFRKEVKPVGSAAITANVPDGWGYFNGKNKISWGVNSENNHSGKYSCFLRLDEAFIDEKTGEKRVNVSLLLGKADGYTGKAAITVEGNTSYSFSFWSRGNILHIKVKVILWSTENAEAKERKIIDAVMKGPVNLSDQWVQFSGTFTTEANSQKAAVVLNITEAEPGQTLYVDDAVLFKNQSPPDSGKSQTGMLPGEINISGEQYLPKLQLNSAEEAIYGISFKIRSDTITLVQPNWITWYDKDKKKIRSSGVDLQYGTYNYSCGPEWQSCFFEFMSKKNDASVELRLKVSVDNNVIVKDLELVKGGFPPQGQSPSAPYLDWIMSLQVNSKYSDAMSKNISLTAATPDQIKQHREFVIPYMEIPLTGLLEQIPQKRPDKVGIFYTSMDSGRIDYVWDIRKPDELRDRSGNIVDMNKYPETGKIEITAPSGKADTYSYSDVTENRNGSSETTRYYLNNFMVTAKYQAFLTAAYYLARIYQASGDAECARRSAALLWGLCRNIKDWPVYGRVGNHLGPYNFVLPDCYEEWFTFIAGNWYIPSTARMSFHLTIFLMLKDSKLWDEIKTITSSNPRGDIEQTLLYIAQQSLKRDAYYRMRPWILYHNTTPPQIDFFMRTGNALGSPELVHYGIRKAKAIVQHTIMADGMFPESVSYMAQHVVGLYNIFQDMNYSDPAGYLDKVDSGRIDNFEIANYMPQLAESVQLVQLLRYPDGSLMTIHDTWAESVLPDRNREKFIKKTNTSFLIPDFGHAVLARGENENMFEAHLEYSLTSTHYHLDLLNLNLWAYGSELCPDLGYTHMGAYNYMTEAHNLVVIDNKFQLLNKDHGSLIAWLTSPDRVQIAQAAQNEIDPVYPEAKLYRRAMVTIPLGIGNDAIVDIFEVTGGSRHDWMANGCADYPQNAVISLNKITGELDNLSEDGKPMEKPFKGYPPKERDCINYGAFRNLKIFNNTEPWNITLTAGKIDPEEFGIAPQALSLEPKPGLRLHWIAPGSGKVLLGETPRGRFYNELKYEKDGTALNYWAKQRMPKIIVRREGKNLESMFIAVWEPFRKQPWLEKAEKISEIDPADGAGIILKKNDITAHVLYRRPESKKVLKLSNIISDAQFAVVCSSSGNTTLDIYNGTYVETGKIALKILPWEKIPVLAQREENGLPALVIDINCLKGYPAKIQPHAGSYIRLDQENAPGWMLPLKKIVKNPDNTLSLVFNRQIGFEYNPKLKILKETCFPFNIYNGMASIVFPSSARLKINYQAENVIKINIDIDAPCELQISQSGKKSAVRLTDEKNESLPVSCLQNNNKLSIILPPVKSGLLMITEE